MPAVATLKGDILRERVAELIIDGTKPSDIDVIVSKESNISHRQVQRYCRDVRLQWLKQQEKTKQFTLVEALAVKKQLFKDARQDDNYKEANIIHNDQCKLNGLFIDKVHHTHDTPPLAVFKEGYVWPYPPVKIDLLIRASL